MDYSEMGTIAYNIIAKDDRKKKTHIPHIQSNIKPKLHRALCKRA